MRYFEYLVSFEDDNDLEFEGHDEIVPINSDEILDMQWTQDWMRKKGDKATEEKAINAWVVNEWAVEINEKQYRKYFK
jgi:hypothetical protein